MCPKASNEFLRSYNFSSLFVSLCLAIQISLQLFSNYLFFCFALIPIFLILFYLFHREFYDTQKEIALSQSVKAYGTISCWFTSFLIILSGQIFYWLAFYPGGFNLDALNQWYQIHGDMPLNAWHSPISTGFYWLITRIDDKLAPCILFQIILFSGAAALLIRELYRQYASFKISVLCSVCIAINPAIGRINICIYKDVLFAIFVVFLYTELFKVFFTNGAILKEKLHFIFLILCLSGIALIRHNGILLVTGVCISFFIYYKKYCKTIITILLSTTFLVIFIEGPLYHFMKIQPHANINGESVGVPMAILANALINDPDHIPQEAATLLHSIQPDDNIWKQTYSTGEWDSCKWTINGEASSGMLLSTTPILTVITATLKAILYCPQTSYQSFRESTRISWQLIGSCNWLPYVFQEDNPYGITYHSIEPYHSLSEKLFLLFTHGPLSIYHWNTGLYTAILLILFLRSVKRKEAQKGILIFPILLYNIGTSFLIAGPNYRYYYYTPVLFLPVALYLFYGKQEN